MTKPRSLVVVAHPDLRHSRVNRAWTTALQAYPASVSVHDLYARYPTGAINVSAEQKLLESHERIILQFPLYWFSTPPLLKQWMDKVFLEGWSHGPNGNKLAGKEIGMAISTGGREAAYRSGGRSLYTIDELLAPLRQTVHFVGGKYLPPFVFYGARFEYTEAQLQESSRQYARHVLQRDLDAHVQDAADLLTARAPAELTFVA